MTALSGGQRGVLTAGLPPDTSAARPAKLGLDDPLEQWADRHKLTGLLTAAVVTGCIAATPEQRAALADRHRLAMARDLLLERTLLRTVQLLERADVPVRVLKGAALAHLDYPDPALRSFGDVDLLVAADAFERAVSALSDDGQQRVFPEPRSGFDRRFGKGTVMRTADGTEIDLHRTFVSGPWGVLLDEAALWAPGERFQLGGTPLVALHVAGRALHAAFQVALDGPHRRASSLRDLAQLLYSSHLEASQLLELAAHCQAEAVLGQAARLVMDELQLHPHPLLRQLAAHRPTRREAQWLALYADPATTYAALSVAAVRALPRFRDRARMALALAAPTSSYVTDRHRSRVSRWRGRAADIRQGMGR